MKASALRKLLADVPDDENVLLLVDGNVVELGASLYVPEWSELYLGEDENEITETLMEQELSDLSGDQQFIHALEEYENAKDAEEYKVKPDLGSTCMLPENNSQAEGMTETM